MDYRYLGRSGLRVSALSFGSWVTFSHQMGEEQAAECMSAAFDAGVNFFDNAEVYADGEAETIMGRVLKRAGWPRSELVISTKIFWGGDGVNQRGLSRKHILEGTDAALARLQLDYVDLVFCHRADLQTPLEETVWAMSHLVTSGRALYWGSSEWSAERILEAAAIARREHLVPPVVEQPEYNMLHRDRVEREYLPLYERLGLGTTVWSPLGGGLLTGKYNDGVPPGSRPTVAGMDWLRGRYEGQAALRNVAKVKLLAPVASELGCTLAQLALAWCLKNPRVSTVITGASRLAQVTENLAALAVVERLDDAVMERVELILANRPEAERDWK